MVYCVHCSAPFFFMLRFYFSPRLNLITNELVFNHSTLFLPLFYVIQFNNPCKNIERNMKYLLKRDIYERKFEKKRV